jgi:ribosomal protein S18 acetylase RimI-like enzyme
MARLTPPADEWTSQAAQYAYRGEPGIHLERHAVGKLGFMTEIDCLLYRDEQGLLVGILNHYCDNAQKAGSCNLWVKPGCRRQGVGTALLAEAMRRWDDIDLSAQNYTFDGVAFINRLIQKGSLEIWKV